MRFSKDTAPHLIVIQFDIVVLFVLFGYSLRIQLTTLIRKKYTIRVFSFRTQNLFQKSHPKLGPRREGKYPSEFPFGPPPGPVHLWSTYFITKSEIQDFFWICSNNKALPGVREPTHASLFSVMSVKHFFGLLFLSWF